MTTLAERVAQFPPEMTEGEIAGVLNTPDPQFGMKNVDVHTVEVRERFLRWGVIGRCTVLTVRPPAQAPDDLLAFAGTILAAMEVPSGGRGIMPTSEPSYLAEMQAMVGQLEALGWLTEAQAGDLMALTTAPISEVEANPSWGPVDSGAVGRARNGGA